MFAQPALRRLIAFLLTVLLVTALSGVPATAQNMNPDDGLGDFVEEIHEEGGKQWWNDDWQYRQRVTIEDPRLLDGSGKAIYFFDPDPLLLYNTGRCQDGMADLRVVTLDGKVLPSGVTNFGRDDGTGLIWCLPQVEDFQKRLDVYIYYGNPRAKPSGDTLPKAGGAKGDPQFVYTRAEETRPGATVVEPIPGSFFHNLVVAEAEQFVPETAFANALVVKKEREKLEIATGDLAENSGEAVLALAENVKTPATAWLSRRIPEAGKWYIHVRYKVRPDRLRTVAKPTRYGLFELLVGEQVIRCESQDGDGAYRWQSALVELPQGEVRLGLRLSTPGEVDCVLLTRDAHYKPDFRDINGPVWMRFKALEKVSAPFYVDLFCMHTTSSLHGAQGNTASYLFRDRLVYPKNMLLKQDRGYTRQSQLPFYAAALPRDPRNLFKADEWTPWGETLPRGSFTWFSQVRFLTSGQGKRPRNLSGLKVGYEFATRPHASRLYRSGVNDCGPSNLLYVHMPSRLDLDTLQKMTLTFDDWGKQRLAMLETLGFKSGEGPKSIVAATMVTTYSPQDTQNAFNALDAIGLNAVSFRYAVPGKVPEELFADTKMKWSWEHNGTPHDFFNNFFIENPTPPAIDTRHVLDRARRGPDLIPIAEPLPGMTCGQTIEKIIAEKSDEHFRLAREAQKRSSPWEYSRVRFNIMGDEIGPAIGGHAINDHPLFKGFFIEYLQQQKLEPAFFGVKTWKDMAAVDYKPKLSKQEENLQQVIEDEAEAMSKIDNPTSGLLDSSNNKPVDLSNSVLEEKDDKSSTPKVRGSKAGDNQEEDDEPNPGALGAAEPIADVEGARHSRFEKRAYHWTQKFRSYYTAMYYRHHTAALEKYYPEGIRSSPNLQAMPVQIGRMWDGGLNIFDLGRMNAFNALQVEDWNWSHQNVRFGMNLLRAAARKNGQPLSSLVVGGRCGQRIMADLMQGSRNFLFYLYGPLYTIGPPWAEDKETQRQIGNMMRQIGRTEPDLLAAKNRPADAAILVANTSEINSVYYKYPFERERVAIYNALNDAQVPVDLVGEEEVLEDNALSRYKVLYVCDPHVDSRAQKKIKEWVANGGTLWADYAGLARQEYDEPSQLFDEVFGLQSRGPIVPYTYGGYGVAAVPLGQPVKITKSDVFEADDIEGINFRGKADELNGHHAVPNWKLSTGRVLAIFGDGKPAIVHNKFGKGQAWLCGFLAGLSYGGSGGPYSAPAGGPSATALRGQLMTVPALRANVRPHIKTTEHGLSVAVHDGPEQTVVYIINGPRDLRSTLVEVSLPKPPKSAYSGSGRPVEFKANGTTATVELTLAGGECDIVVFRY